MKNSDFTADTLELNSGEEFSNHKFTMGVDEDGWLLLRAFRSITNAALRSTILDVVSALAWQDSQVRAGRPPIAEH
jgi:hypothetical protein